VRNDLAANCQNFSFLLSLCVSGPVPQCFVPLVCSCGKCVSLVAGVAGELDARCASWLVLAETCGVFRLLLSSQCGVDLCVRGPVPQCFVPLVCPCGKCVSLVAGVAGKLDARCASCLVLAGTCGVFRLVLSSQCGVDLSVHQLPLPVPH